MDIEEEIAQALLATGVLRRAWEFFTRDDREMSHDFRGGYHQGVIDEARRAAVPEPQGEPKTHDRPACGRKGEAMTATARSARQSTADHAGREARIEAVTRDVIRMDVPQMIARASYWRGWCIDNEIENSELVRLRYLLDAVAEHLKDERDAEKQKETP